MARITGIDIIPTKIELTEPFVISKGALTHASNTVIIIHSDQGIFGTGECSLNRSVLGETQEGVVEIAKILAGGLTGKDPATINQLVGIMDKMKMGNHSTKSAFDMALYDLASKLNDQPLYAFLHAAKKESMTTDMTISLMEAEKMADKAEKYLEMGFTVLKVKLGERPSSRDIERIRAIRQRIGLDIPLRIDANQGWNLNEASHALEALADLNIQHCEEPLPCWNRIDQVKLNRSSPIPIMADESVFSHNDTYQVLTSGAASMINIKLGKSGGICHGLKITAVAEAADVYCQVGTFSESRLGISALAHFACASDKIRHYDMDTPMMLSEDPVIGGITYNPDWSIAFSDAPGHGAEIDPEFLKQFPKISIS